MSAQLVAFTLENGAKTHMLISENIPISVTEGVNGSVVIQHPSHNNGGYRLHSDENLRDVLRRINKVLEFL